MANELNNPTHIDILEKLETGKKINLEHLEAIKAKNYELFEILDKSNQLRDSIKVTPSSKFARSSQVRLFYRVVEPRLKPTLIESIKQSAQSFLSQISLPQAPKLSPVLSILIVIILSFSVIVGGAQAADNAGPGDFLYPLDIAIEEAQLFLTRTAEHRLQLRIGFAQERLTEAQEAYSNDDTGHGEEALFLYENQLTAISDLQANTTVEIPDELQQIIDQSNKNNTIVLVGLLEKVPENAQAAILHAIEMSAGDKDTPPGQDDDFTPPGQDEDFTPPGQDEDFTPPGQEDKDTPPGQDPEKTPPGLEDKDKDKDVPPGQLKKTLEP